MNLQVKSRSLWEMFDRLLLTLVFILLGVTWYKLGPPERAFGVLRAKSEKTERTRLPSGLDQRVVEGIRVTAGNRRMDSIARAMIASDWHRSVPCPAMDMRENGQSYEVRFFLPERVDRKSVQVTSAGQILTLTMRSLDTDKLAKHRLRIPCDMDKKSLVQSVVSNHVLYVRIVPR